MKYFFERYFITFILKKNIPSGQRIARWLCFITNINTLITKTKYGFLMYVNLKDLIQRSIFYNGVWENNLSNYLANNLNEKDIFYDIGSNVGYFSLLAVTNEAKQVYAFEPDPQKVEAILRNLDLNKISKNQIEVLTIGLDTVPQEKTYYRANEANSGISGFVNRGVYNDKFSVHLNSIDNLINENLIDIPTILKIDTEGWEENILKGSINLLKNKPPRIIIFEAEEDSVIRSNKSAIIDLLQSFDYVNFLEFNDNHGINIIAIHRINASN